MSTGGRAAPDPEAPSVSVGQLRMLWKEGVEEDKDHSVLVQNEEKMLVSQQQQQQPETVVKLSFGEDQKVSVEEARLLELTPTEKLNKKDTSVEIDLFEDSDHQMDSSSCDEEMIEPSTDEELKMWRYPNNVRHEESIVSEEEEVEELAVGREEKGEEEVSVLDQSQVSVVQSMESYLGDVSTDIPSSCEVPKDSSLCREQVTTESCNGCNQDMINGDDSNVTVSADQKDIEGCTVENDKCCEQSEDMQTFTDDEKQTDLSSHSREEEMSRCLTVDETPDKTPTVELDLQKNTGDTVHPTTDNLIDICDDPSLCLTKSEVTDTVAEGIDKKCDCSDDLLVESCKAEEGENSKKVTFMLEPELISGSGLCQAGTSEEPRAETSLSGKDRNKTGVSTGLHQGWWTKMVEMVAQKSSMYYNCMYVYRSTYIHISINSM